MKSLQVKAPEQVAVIDSDNPSAGPGQVLLAMRACAICNQHDSAIFHGSPHGGKKEYPLEPGFPGHEGAGEIVEVGEGVEGLAVGDHVVTTGIGGPPLYSEYVPRDASAVVKIDPSVPWEHAAPLELFGCVHRAFTLTSSVEGKRVGVVGLGPAGQAAVAIARAYGAPEVLATDLDESRRTLSQTMGATQTLDAAMFEGANDGAIARACRHEPPTDAQSKAIQAVKDHACDIVFDCSGNPRGTELALLLAMNEVTIFGYVNQPITAAPCLWFLKELVIRNSMILQISDLQAVADMLCAGTIQTGPIVSCVLPFRQYEEAIDRIQRREAIKVALVWEE